MTNKELNRDIKRLQSDFKKHWASFGIVPNNDYYAQTDLLHKEYKRLYYADSTGEAMNYTSFKFMYRVNLRERILPLHTFGLNIEL